MESDLFTSSWPLLLLDLFHVPPSWAKTPFIVTSFLSLSLMFRLSRFQWQCSLKCPSLLHWPQITSVFFPLLTLSYLVGGSNNFLYSLVSPIFFSQVIIASLCLNKVCFFILTMAIWKYGYKLVWKKVVKNIENNLLVSIYIHNIFPPSRCHLVLSLVMPCTLVHMFVLFYNTYKTKPLILQIYKLDGLS